MVGFAIPGTPKTVWVRWWDGGTDGPGRVAARMDNDIKLVWISEGEFKGIWRAIPFGRYRLSIRMLQPAG